MNTIQRDNLYIKEIIEKNGGGGGGGAGAAANKPFFIGRIAGCELQIAYLYSKGLIYDIVDELENLQNNAGIYTTDIESLETYVNMLVNSYTKCTVIAEWEQTGKVFKHTGSSQDFITNKTQTIPKIDARALEPYYFKDNWMSALEGKKILIIHPFAKTFTQQLPNLNKIFPGFSWFENCTIQFCQPPLTLAKNHDNKDWQEHYRSFVETLKTVQDFDIALVAAGGYGMLISEYIYSNMGKSVIYIGGALQLFFGVIGKRWFDNKNVMKLVNDNWIRPLNEDKPANYINVEKGCYW
jgi:hypothetical protein